MTPGRGFDFSPLNFRSVRPNKQKWSVNLEVRDQESCCLPSQHSAARSGLGQVLLTTLPPFYGGSGGKRGRHSLDKKSKRLRWILGKKGAKKRSMKSQYMWTNKVKCPRCFFSLACHVLTLTEEINIFWFTLMPVITYHYTWIEHRYILMCFSYYNKSKCLLKNSLFTCQQMLVC